MLRLVICLITLATLWHAEPARAEISRGQTLAEIAAQDAQLRDLMMIDGRHGWAVGDRGVILRTDDGGRLWIALDSPVDCSLYSVSFVDRRHGWAVGGTTMPYTHSTRGVVLQTSDGGATWRQLPSDTLPLLRHVQFFPEAEPTRPKRGIAVGAGTSFSPSGVFVTDDGGRSWTSLSTGSSAAAPNHWLAADFVSPRLGVTTSARGQLAMIARSEVQPSAAFASERRGLRGVKLQGNTGGWLVGDGGTVLTTPDGGRSWLPPPAPLPEVARQHFDWHTVASQGKQVWIAGMPGSVVLHSADAGETWQLQPTGITTPLVSIDFVDERRGWACGALGTILATTDGGQTWQSQRAAGKRTAIDILTTGIYQTPLELIGKMAAAEGYLTSVGMVFGPEAGNQLANHDSRQTEAAIAAGATTTHIDWRLAVRDEEQTLSAEALLQAFNNRTDDRAMQQLEAALVARFRSLRPDVVVVSASQSQAASVNNGANQLLATIVTKAIESAGDATKYPELQTAGLAPWQPKRLIGLSDDGVRQTAGFATGDFDSLLGTSVTQWTAAARRLLQTKYLAPPARIGWRVLAGSAAPGSRGELLAGISVPRGGDARRPAAMHANTNLDALRSLANKRRNVQQLLARTEGTDAWIGQVVNLTGGLDADSGAELLYQLAAGYRDAGKLDLAADSFYLLSRRYTNHPLTEPALTWLLRYYASSELALRNDRARGKRMREPAPLANVAANQRDAAEADQLEAFAGKGNSPGALSQEERFERASQLGRYLEQARPAVFAEPSIRFPIAVAQRNRGFTKDAARSLLILTKQSIDPAWRRCAEAEQWLAKPIGSTDQLPPSKPIVTCKSIAVRPHLDGRFDEACWQKAEVISLQAIASDTEPSNDQPSLTTVRFARDEEFIYLAGECPKRASTDYSLDADAANAPRPRDANLAPRDRVTFRIDTDRDYTTAFELSVDSRGWTSDNAWGDLHWNPKWFVAAAQTATHWTFEIAIPVDELAHPRPAPRDAWAVGILRQAPGERPTSWTAAPATEEKLPDHFGLMLLH